MIYLDNNATTCLDPLVLEAMLPYLRQEYGNPSSMHRFGQEARQAIEQARHQVASLLHCDAREIIFTSGGTEADNAAILGALQANPQKRTVITTTVEHSAVGELLHHLAPQGVRIIEITVDCAGTLNMAALAAALEDPQVALASIMWANNETGVIFDIPAVAALCAARGVPLHVDAVQAAGKMPIDLRAVPVSLLSVSAHKLHGPKGAGALYVRRQTRWQPVQRGGPQERQRRGGTENVPGIVGFGKAAEIAGAALADAAAGKHIEVLRDRLESGILQSIADTSVNGAGPRVPNTTNISFAHLEAEAILLLLSEQEVCASAGAACASGSLEPSHVLRAMHVPDAQAHGAVRFSLSKYTTDEEVDQAIAILPGVVERLRQVLPVA